MYDIDSFAYDASNYWLTEPKKSWEESAHEYTEYF